MSPLAEIDHRAEAERLLQLAESGVACDIALAYAQLARGHIALIPPVGERRLRNEIADLRADRDAAEQRLFRLSSAIRVYRTAPGGSAAQVAAGTEIDQIVDYGQGA